MAGTFNEAISASESDFDRFVAPIMPWMLNGNITSVESDGSAVSRILEMRCGIDYLLECNGLVYGVARRIQRLSQGDSPWNTFTVRHERDSGSCTELEKRGRSILQGSICPMITYQAYVSSDGKLLSMAVAFTKDIIEHCLFNDVTSKHTGDNQIGQASFIAVKWQDMANHGYTLRTYSRNRGLIQHFDHGHRFDLYSLNDDGMPQYDLQCPTPGF